MKYCTHCGNEMGDGAVFCTKCGCALSEKSATNKPDNVLNNETETQANNAVNIFQNRLSIIGLVLGVLGLLSTLILYLSWFSTTEFISFLQLFCLCSGLFVCGLLAVIICCCSNKNITSITGLITGSISVGLNCILALIIIF